MTGAEFSEVDFDLLADYVGGALDGTPDEAVVTALIEGHPTWRAAYHRLTGGVAAVTAGLRSWGTEPEPMPADVMARLDAAFSSATPDTFGAPAASLGDASPAGFSPADASPAGFSTADASSAGFSPADAPAANPSSSSVPSSPTGAPVADPSPAGAPVADPSPTEAPVAGSSATGSSVADQSPAGAPSATRADDEVAATGANSARAEGDVAGAGAVGAGVGAVGAGPVGATAGGERMEPGSDGAAPARHLVAVPDDDERPATARKRTRRLKWAAPIGIAAGVIAFVGVGIQQFGTGTDSSDQATSAAGSAAEQEAPAAAGPLALPAGPAQVGASGVDYDRESLRQVAVQAVAAAGSGKDRVPQSTESGGVQSRASGPGPSVMADTGDPLVRLFSQEALLACIDAISRENGAGPVTAEVLDYARFQGAPALVVQFSAANGTWVWATGADCGLPGSGADRLGLVKVG